MSTCGTWLVPFHTRSGLSAVLEDGSPHLGRDLPAQGSGCTASLQGRFSTFFTPSPQLPLRAELSLSLGRLAVHARSPPCPAYFLPPFCDLQVF